MSRGLTLPELLVGVVTASVIALVSAYLFKLGITAYRYGTMQSAAMISGAKAQDGQGAAEGMLWALREAHSVDELTVSSFTALSSSTLSTAFYVSGDTLFRDDSGSAAAHADDVTAVAVNYYGLDASGLIFESTAAHQAALVTTLVTVKPGTGRNYSFYSGARLRNR